MSVALISSPSGLTNSKLALADADTSEVLSGKTFYSQNKELKTGEMPNNGAVSLSVDAGKSVTIPAGYHNGTGKVTATLGKLTMLTSTSFSLGDGTSTTVSINLSSYDVKDKTKDDFVLGIRSLTASASYSESRTVSSITITAFNGTTLTAVANHDPYTYHAQHITFGIGVYCVM